MATLDPVRKIGNAVRRVRNRFRPGVVILMYHRVADVPLDPFTLAVSKKHFAEHLEVLRRFYRPLALQRVVGCLDRGELPRRGVVVTFDDGYADNVFNAEPLLERFEIPATVFCVSGQLGSQQEFWWDELSRLLLHPHGLPTELSIDLHGEPLTWDLKEASQSLNGSAPQRNNFHLDAEYDPTPRHALLRALRERIYRLPPEGRQTVLEELKRWAGVQFACRPEYRAMSETEAAQLAAGGLVEIGAHTMSHSSLATLPVATQRDEIRASRTRLESAIGKPVKSFSYPFGHPRTDYTDETVAEVREAGFNCACSGFADLARHGVDVFQLPRPMVLDWNGDQLEEHLRGWFSWY